MKTNNENLITLEEFKDIKYGKRVVKELDEITQKTKELQLWIKEKL